MKVKLYKAGKKFDGYADQYSLYFPYPKWLQEHDHSRGGFIGCSQGADGDVIRCTWEDDCLAQKTNLGKRYPLEKMSKQFQKWAHHLEHLFNEALKHDDDEHWDAFSIA